MITDYIRIKNFKSIHDLKLKDCKRINLLIGPPNVGKSNIMEALSLFDVPFHLTKNIYSDILKSRMRIERMLQLFHYGDSKEKITVETSRQKVSLGLINQGINPELDFNIESEGSLIYTNSNDNLITKGMPDIMVYTYSRSVKFRSSHLDVLRPPYGSNLMQVINENPRLKENLREILSGYGFQSVYVSSDEDFKAMKQDKDGNVFMVPYESLAESIKHLMFYKAAVLSNNNKAICFEEPESNTFPPYITNLVDTIIGDMNDNQFFITTHSPYIINHLLESGAGDLAIYKIGLKEGGTTAYRLSEEDLRNAIDYNMDLLFNIEAFTENI